MNLERYPYFKDLQYKRQTVKQTSMQKKATELGLSLDDICKTVVFASEYGLYLTCVPGSYKVNSNRLQEYVRKPLVLSKALPMYMTKGTCGPFPSDRNDVAGIFYDLPAQDMEFSVPGEPNESLIIHTDQLFDAIQEYFPITNSLTNLKIR